jgi:hypothetical protein
VLVRPARLVAFLCVALAACSPVGGSGGGGGDGGGGSAGGTGGSGGRGGTGGSGGSGDPGGSGGSASMPGGPLIDPDSLDGQYREVLPDPAANIDDLAAGYRSANVNDFVLQVLRRRYDVGYLIVSGVMPSFDCITPFLAYGSATPLAVYQSLQTVVHECGHIYDNGKSGAANAYVLTRALTLSCSGGDSVARGGKTFERSRIRKDAFSAARPPCSDAGGAGCDFYADTYLDGDPDDATFQGGDQGFNELLEEETQYVNSLASAYVFQHELSGGGSTSARDGILTMLWYVERYLHMARMEYPTAYDHLVDGDGGCWRRAILTLWGRAFLYLEATRDMPWLGISDGTIQELVATPELVDEIQRLRDADR